jgi:hypothetical protein
LKFYAWNDIPYGISGFHDGLNMDCGLAGFYVWSCTLYGFIHNPHDHNLHLHPSFYECFAFLSFPCGSTVLEEPKPPFLAVSESCFSTLGRTP